jgi:hypothetical protein
MAVTGALALRDALAGRVRRIPGMREASGVLGPEFEPKQVVDRSFTVFLGAEGDAGGRTRTDGSLFVLREFSIRLCHKLNAARNAAALGQAYADADDVKKIVLGHVEDAYVECEPHTAFLGLAEPELLGGGTFLLTILRFRTRYRMTIEPLPG